MLDFIVEQSKLTRSCFDFNCTVYFHIAYQSSHYTGKSYVDPKHKVWKRAQKVLN